MPERRERPSTLLTRIGRPSPRLDPPPASSSGCSSAAAQATTSPASFALAGENTATAASRSEARQVGKPDLPAVDVHAPEFGAAVELREHLAGVEQPARVEGALDPLLLGEVGLVEHLAHQVALLDPDAVLARQHAADLDAELEDVGAERLRAVQLAQLVGVVEDERVQVAVAGVEHVGT